jgi:hypothetical protein
MIIFLFQVTQFNLMVDFIEANTPGRNGVNLNKWRGGNAKYDRNWKPD